MILHSESIGALQSAAFFMEGLHDCCAGYDTLLKVWDKGCFELVSGLVCYAIPVDRAVQRISGLRTVGVPGVFDYEVSSTFGRWYGQQILESGGEEPTPAQVCTYLRESMKEFFVSTTPFSDLVRIHQIIDEEIWCGQ